VPAWTPKEKEWKAKLYMALKAKKKWEEFRTLKNKIQKEVEPEASCNAMAEKIAWHRAFEQYQDVLDMEKFELDRSVRLYEAKEKRKKTALLKARLIAIDPAKEGPKISDAEDGDVIIIANGIEGDILRDTKWVYNNMARLIKVARGGIRSLDRKVLKEAPSNGAVGLAQYALDDQKAFFERFVTKILPKDEVAPVGPTEEELKADLDPTLDELSKYIRKTAK
jgi:hypothetical protein